MRGLRQKRNIPERERSLGGGRQALAGPENGHSQCQAPICFLILDFVPDISVMRQRKEAMKPLQLLPASKTNPCPVEKLIKKHNFFRSQNWKQPRGDIMGLPGIRGLQAARTAALRPHAPALDGERLRTNPKLLQKHGEPRGCTPWWECEPGQWQPW